jgi:beta-lactam-binding protein with PASTA domain
LLIEQVGAGAAGVNVYRDGQKVGAAVVADPHDPSVYAFRSDMLAYGSYAFVAKAISPGQVESPPSNLLTVIVQPATATVPALVGQSQAQAQAALSQAGLNLGAVTQQCSDSAASGIVIEQSPAAGSAVADGRAVSVAVSSGPCNALVPSVVGQSQAQAQAALSQAGFALAASPQCSDAVAAGTVIEQSPAAGSAAAGGLAVAVTVSSGTCATAKIVPGLVGLSQAQAQAAP